MIELATQGAPPRCARFRVLSARAKSVTCPSTCDIASTARNPVSKPRGAVGSAPRTLLSVGLRAGTTRPVFFFL
jgi:hypothetical protein